MTGLGRLLAIVAVGALLIPVVVAQDPAYAVRAYIDPADGAETSRPFRLVVRIEGASTPQISAPRLSGLKNLRVINGPATSSSFEWVNGRSSSNVDLIYTVKALGPGKAEIPALEVRIDGKPFRTAPLRFNVEKTVAPRGPSATPAPRPGKQQQQRPNGRPGTGRDDRFDIRLEVEAGTSSAWVGQAIPLRVLLYSRESVTDPRWSERPTLDRFWVESVEVDSNAESFRRRLGDREYNVFPMERRILIPPGPGTFEIEPYVIQLQARRRSNDPFDVFSFGRFTNVLRRSNSLKIEVKPLPAGAPPEFAGAVGVYTMTANLDRTEAQVDEAVSLRVSIRGKGSLRAVEPPTLDFPPELKPYEPKVTESYDTTGGEMKSTKTWEWVLIPLAPGDVRVPELRFVYFNPAREQYELASAESRVLSVGRGSGASSAPTARGGIELQQRELNYIKLLRGDLLRQDGRRLHERGAILALLLLPWGLAPLAILIGRRRARLSGDLVRVRARGARTKARKRFRTIRRSLEQDDPQTFHDEVGRTLVEYVADRFDRSAAGLTYDLAEELLTSRAVDPALRRRFRSCLESCDFARFVPSSAQAERRSELLDQAMAIVEDLERAW